MQSSIQHSASRRATGGALVALAAIALTGCSSPAADPAAAESVPASSSANPSKYPDSVRFEARRDCAGPSTGGVVDYVADAGESSAEAVMRPTLGQIQREHGPVTPHVVTGATGRAGQASGRQSVVYRVDDAGGEPVGEIAVVEVSPGRWRLEGYGSCAVTWVGDSETPPLDVLQKRGVGQMTPLREWSGSSDSDRLTVHFIGAPNAANRPGGRSLAPDVRPWS